MLNQTLLKPTKNSKKSSKRLGRGNGSGKGTFSGKGCKGQNARSGSKYYPTFEGGQTPIFRRMPKKRGFKALDKVVYSVVNLVDLEKLATAGTTKISNIELMKAGLIKKESELVKILGTGEITAKIEVKANKISKSAQEKIEKAGGKVELV